MLRATWMRDSLRLMQNSWVCDDCLGGTLRSVVLHWLPLPPPRRSCFTRRSFVCLSVSNLTQNYWPDFHESNWNELKWNELKWNWNCMLNWKFYIFYFENFYSMPSVDKKVLVKFWKSPGFALAEVCSLRVLSLLFLYRANCVIDQAGCPSVFDITL